MDAFDAAVLIYAAVPEHPVGRLIRRLLEAPTAPPIGSTLLLPEVLSKPTRDGSEDELTALLAVLSRLDLRPCDEATATLAVGLAAAYALRAPDAIHHATAVAAGAHRFSTSNTRDFPLEVAEVAVTYPEALAEPAT